MKHASLFALMLVAATGCNLASDGSSQSGNALRDGEPVECADDDAACLDDQDRKDADDQDGRPRDGDADVCEAFEFELDECDVPAEKLYDLGQEQCAQAGFDVSSVDVKGDCDADDGLHAVVECCGGTHPPPDACVWNRFESEVCFEAERLVDTLAGVCANLGQELAEVYDFIPCAGDAGEGDAPDEEADADDARGDDVDGREPGSDGGYAGAVRGAEFTCCGAVEPPTPGPQCEWHELEPEPGECLAEDELVQLMEDKCGDAKLTEYHFEGDECGAQAKFACCNEDPYTDPDAGIDPDSDWKNPDVDPDGDWKDPADGYEGDPDAAGKPADGEKPFADSPEGYPEK